MFAIKYIFVTIVLNYTFILKAHQVTIMLILDLDGNTFISNLS